MIPLVNSWQGFWDGKQNPSTHNYLCRYQLITEAWGCYFLVTEPLRILSSQQKCAMRFVTQGIHHNTDLAPTKLYKTVGSLYSEEVNPSSKIPTQFHILLPQVANVADFQSIRDKERVHDLLYRTSASRARSYINKFCAMQLDDELYDHVQQN